MHSLTYLIAPTPLLPPSQRQVLARVRTVGVTMLLIIAASAVRLIAHPLRTLRPPFDNLDPASLLGIAWGIFVPFLRSLQELDGGPVGRDDLLASTIALLPACSPIASSQALGETSTHRAEALSIARSGGPAPVQSPPFSGIAARS